MCDSMQNAFDLGSVFTLHDIEGWKERLLGALANVDGLVLQGGDIEQIDGAGIQLLLALKLEAETTGKYITWQSVSEELAEAAHALGLNRQLGLD